ncbi:MAG: nitrogenase component 1 [Anaerovoracaceae bacterium]|nr:nitrogenase component 1 [Bacillota bacterium]MDY2670206.1 nitrogenase component 1 [Anaerovoracaceae bacterium]
MKGMLKYLSPFAPDQSGAVSVLYDMGGITVTCDAGGCTGNICGFDEPRWTDSPRAVFSAGLRDMDAILGRDDKLVEKLGAVSKKIDAPFAAIVGTPVPAVIGTDFHALVRMTEKRCGLPAISVECTGTHLYDKGASDTYKALFKKFAEDVNEEDKPAASEDTLIGVLGMIPLEISRKDGVPAVKAAYEDSVHRRFLCYGMGSGIEDIRKAGMVSENIVVSPSGLAAAKYLKKRFGTTYRIDYPFIDKELEEKLRTLAGKKVLVIHQQAAADKARDIIEEAGGAGVVCGSWFMQPKEMTRQGDIALTTEKQFMDIAASGDFDVIIADELMRRAAKSAGFSGEFVEFNHFAVSGDLDDE